MLTLCEQVLNEVRQAFTHREKIVFHETVLVEKLTDDVEYAIETCSYLDELFNPFVVLIPAYSFPG